MILVISHEASLTGAPKSLLELCRFLHVEMGYEFIFILQRGGALIQEYEKIGETLIWNEEYNSNLLHRVKRRILSNKDQITKKILKLDRNGKISHVYFNTVAHSTDIVNNFTILNAPVITHVREINSVIHFFNSNKSVEKLISKSDKIIAISSSVKSSILEVFDISKNKISVIHNGLNFTDISTETNMDELLESLNLIDKKIVLSHGSCIYRKEPDLFIRSANELINVRNRNDIHFIWIGGNQDSLFYLELLEEIKKYKLDNNVSIIPTQQNVFPFLKLATIYLMTSREEAFGRVLIESAEMALPIIGFSNSGFPEEYIEEGYNGYLVEYGDVEKMAEKINEIIDNTGHLEELGLNNKQKGEKYSLKATSNLIDKLLQSMIS